MTEYHRVNSCNKCGGENWVSVKALCSGHIAEADTECQACGFRDYWAYGFFESGATMVSNCEKYRP